MFNVSDASWRDFVCLVELSLCNHLVGYLGQLRDRW